jgi:hypothetical protein
LNGPREAAGRSELDLLGQAQRIVDLDPEIADRALNLSVEKQLDRSQISMGLVVDAARKDEGVSIWRALVQPVLRRSSGLFRDLKLNRTAGLVLDDPRPLSYTAARSYVVDPKADGSLAQQLETIAEARRPLWHRLLWSG